MFQHNKPQSLTEQHHNAIGIEESSDRINRGYEWIKYVTLDVECEIVGEIKATSKTTIVVRKVSNQYCVHYWHKDTGYSLGYYTDNATEALDEFNRRVFKALEG